MKIYLLKWFSASLVMPLIVLFFGRILNLTLVLIFWPSSIVLMALGAEERPWTYVIFVWGTAIGINIILYLCIGLAIYFLRRKMTVKH